MKNGFNQLMTGILSMEGDDGLKREGNDDYKETGTVSIDLDDYAEDDVAFDRIKATLKARGYQVERYSSEDSVNLTANEFNPDSVKVMDTQEQVDGNDNLVVNGEFLPDTIVQMTKDAQVKVISPMTKLPGFSKDLIYYVIGDEGDLVYNHLKRERLYVAKDPLELAQVIEFYRHGMRK